MNWWIYRFRRQKRTKPCEDRGSGRQLLLTFITARGRYKAPLPLVLGQESAGWCRRWGRMCVT